MQNWDELNTVAQAVGVQEAIAELHTHDVSFGLRHPLSFTWLAHADATQAASEAFARENTSGCCAFTSVVSCGSDRKS